jgi:pimeloyl-ACP methyl ester carboxylesterase
VLPALAQHGRMIAIDLPGFGRSAPLPAKAGTDFHYRVLLALLDELKLDRVRLVGHSMGGMLCHKLALEHPERVRSLVLVSGSLYMKDLKVQPRTLLFFLPRVGRWMLTRHRASEATAFESLRPFYADLDAFPAAEKDFLQVRVNWRVRSEAFIHAHLRSLRSLAGLASPLQADLPGRLTAAGIPSLLVYGERDALVSPANLRGFAASEPGLRVVSLPDAGHNLQQEFPHRLILAMGELDRIMDVGASVA